MAHVFLVHAAPPRPVAYAVISGGDQYLDVSDLLYVGGGGKQPDVTRGAQAQRLVDMVSCVFGDGRLDDDGCGRGIARDAESTRCRIPEQRNLRLSAGQAPSTAELTWVPVGLVGGEASSTRCASSRGCPFSSRTTQSRLMCSRAARSACVIPRAVRAERTSAPRSPIVLISITDSM